MFPSVRSRHALLGKDAARAATRRIPPVLRGTVTGRYRRLIKPVGTPSRSYEPPLALAARATCYTVTSCYSRLPGHTVGTEPTQECMPQTVTPPIVDRSRFFARRFTPT